MKFSFIKDRLTGSNINKNDVEKDSVYLPWRLARDLGKLSYEMALRREQIIDDKLGKIMTFISLIIGSVTFLFSSKLVNLDKKVTLYLFIKVEFNCKVLFAIIMILLFIILFIAMYGQFGFSKEYILPAKDLLNNFQKREDEYKSEDSINYAFVDQYDKIHKSLNTVLEKKTNLLNVVHILMFFVIGILGFTFIYFILNY